MKFIQVVAYECDGMLAFKHTIIEADSEEDAYSKDVDEPEGFRNWYVIPLGEMTFSTLQCGKCSHIFKVDNDIEGVITCPYCSNYIEG